MQGIHSQDMHLSSANRAFLVRAVTLMVTTHVSLPWEVEGHTSGSRETASEGLCPHLLTLLPTALHEDVTSRAPLLLLLLACPLAAELAQLLVQPPLQLGPLGRVQGSVLGPTAWVEHSFPANPLPGMGASLFTTAVDLKGHESQGEQWAGRLQPADLCQRGHLRLV